MEKRVLRTPQAADYTGLKASTLEKKRLDGSGPEFIRLGQRAVGYEIKALDAWLDSRQRAESHEGV